MAVEIHILSGSQQGRCFRFDGDRILVGDVTVADVRFDPDRESRAQGMNAIITLDDEEGWRISNMGTGVWLVNQTSVEPSQTNRLRSEDLVRVSETGPDLCFRIVAGPHGCAIPAAVTTAASGEEPSAQRGEFLPPPVCASPKGRREEVPAVREPNLAQSPLPKPQRRRRVASSLGRLIGVLVSGLLGLVCAYGIACWIGGAKNDLLHVFSQKLPSPSAQAPIGEAR